VCIGNCLSDLLKDIQYIDGPNNISTMLPQIGLLRGTDHVEQNGCNHAKGDIRAQHRAPSKYNLTLIQVMCFSLTSIGSSIICRSCFSMQRPELSAGLVPLPSGADTMDPFEATVTTGSVAPHSSN
jgi:hypothetical protein